MCFFCLVFAMSSCASVYMCFVITCWERADLLALVDFSNENASLQDTFYNVILA